MKTAFPAGMGSRIARKHMCTLYFHSRTWRERSCAACCVVKSRLTDQRIGRQNDQST